MTASKEQTITSKGTDLRQIPALLRLGDRRGYWKRGNINLDWGGGASDRFTSELDKRGVTNMIIDPYNRSIDHNNIVRDSLKFAGGAHSATCSNVLNVINSDSAIEQAIYNIHRLLQDDGRAYFTVYEGHKDGEGRPTIKGWQRHQPLSDYIFFITPHFGAGNVVLSGRVIEAVKRG